MLPSANEFPLPDCNIVSFWWMSTSIDGLIGGAFGIFLLTFFLFLSLSEKKADLSVQDQEGGEMICGR